MRLNHIDIAVHDVSAARAFLETYFDLHCIAERGTVAIMRDDAGVIVALSNFGHAKEVTYPKEFHVGFFQNTKERVDEIFERLQADGYASRKPKNLHGAWTFYFTAPGGFLVEVGHQYGVHNASLEPDNAQGTL